MDAEADVGEVWAEVFDLVLGLGDEDVDVAGGAGGGERALAAVPAQGVVEVDEAAEPGAPGAGVVGVVDELVDVAVFAQAEVVEGGEPVVGGVEGAGLERAEAEGFPPLVGPAAHEIDGGDGVFGGGADVEVDEEVLEERDVEAAVEVPEAVGFGGGGRVAVEICLLDGGERVVPAHAAVEGEAGGHGEARGHALEVVGGGEDLPVRGEPEGAGERDVEVGHREVDADDQEAAGGGVAAVAGLEREGVGGVVGVPVVERTGERAVGERAGGERAGG